METLDFSTVYMAILTSNLLLMIIALIICSERILINAGYKLITVFLILTAVRFMLPIEVPFATTIPMSRGISKIIIELFASRFKIGGLDFSIYYMILIVWLIGAVIQICRFIRVNRMIKSYIFTFGRNISKTSCVTSALDIICNNNQITPSSFRVFELPDIQTPFLYGFTTPYILLPADSDYTDKELFYVLKHEVVHYKHCDLWVKLSVHILTILYWWNPFSYLLSSQINLVIEMKIDDTITGMNKTETLEYMNCLFTVAEKQDSILTNRLGNVIAFSCSEETKLTRRIKMLMRKNTKKKHGFNLVLICLVGCIYLLSYLFIFEAEYYTSDVQEYSFGVTESNSFIIDNGDGTYNLYYNNQLLDTIDSLEFYDENIPVYTKEEYEHVQQSLD